MTHTKQITLFIPCLVDTFAPEVGKAMVQVLQQLGVSLTYPLDQTRCGQPAYNAGYRGESRTAAARFIDIFESADAIVCPSGSCVHMVRHHYLELFADDPHQQKRAQIIAHKTFEFTEYLVDVLGEIDIGATITAGSPTMIRAICDTD